uniref:PSP domain-containing protein n=1 Tax=Caenorhabditis japonica TaxID=281687 RepID=A0A8R1HY93_CAEJA
MSREDGELSDESPKPIEEHEEFVIDRSFSGIIPNEDLVEEAEPQAEKTEKSSSTWQQRMRKRLLGEPEEEESPRNKRRRGASCFNCCGDHNIAQCPEPRDPAAIRKNKWEFQNKNAQQTAGRISKSVESGASKFQPGRLSQSLRDALDIGSDDIPEWVYKMRRMGFHKGYPPGHLKKALKMEYETIKIFAENDEEVKREHDMNEVIRIHEEKVIRQQTLLAKQETGEDEELFVVDRAKTEEVVMETPLKIEKESNVALGESISKIAGTPVFSRRDAAGVWQEQCVPSLEAFAVGIVPFEAKEEDQKTGTFRRIMETLRRPPPS